MHASHRRWVVAALVGAATALPLVGPAPASAASALPRANVSVTFSAAGTLPIFPCTSCGTTFSGTGELAGDAAFAVRGTTDVYHGTYTVPNGALQGSVSYTEPGGTFCPGFGAASGTVSFSGAATGVLTGPLGYGIVSRVTFSGPINYNRDGLGALVFVLGGDVTLDYTVFPWDYGIQGADARSGSITLPVTSGDAVGAFVVNPAQAATDCLHPGPLPFTVAGEAALVS